MLRRVLTTQMRGTHGEQGAMHGMAVSAVCGVMVRCMAGALAGLVELWRGRTEAWHRAQAYGKEMEAHAARRKAMEAATRMLRRAMVTHMRGGTVRGHAEACLSDGEARWGMCGC